MVEVGGTRLIAHLLQAIARADFDEAVIVVGHGGDNLIQYIASLTPQHWQIRFVENKDFATTNNIYSLHLALEASKNSDYSEIAVFESDVYVEPSTAHAYLTDPQAANSALVSPYEYWMEGTAVTIKDNDHIDTFVSKKDISRYSYGELYKTVNWYRFTRSYMQDHYMPFLEAYLAAKGRNSYYEDVLRTISPHVTDELTAYSIPVSKWIEIDDEEDLRRAAIIASVEPSRKASSLAAQYGGFWKHKELTDLTLLENPSFPPPSLLAELRRCLDRAVRAYSSKQSIIASIAAKGLKLEAKNILVGNGASELLSVLFGAHTSRYSIVPPYFLEFERLLPNGRLRLLDRIFPHDPLNSAYQPWSEQSNDNLIVVNPNNPTGELLTKAQIFTLLDRALSAKKIIVVDESFMDFSGDPTASLLTQEIIDRYPNLLVVKSLGKSHGIGGIRLGLLATSDVQLLARLREKLPIWNVSSIAEVYLDLLPKYQDDLRSSLAMIDHERGNLLSQVRVMGLFATQSFANFLLLPLHLAKATSLQGAFFDRGFIVKTISRAGLRGEWLRIPVKDPQTNAIVLDLISQNRSCFMSTCEFESASG